MRKLVNDRDVRQLARSRNLAFDFLSDRTIDQDGRMHVANVPITKATVNGYFGMEIPGWEELGLDPKREYMMLRPPEELERVAADFGGIPLLDEHTPHEASSPVEDNVAGSVSAGTFFDGEYVRTPLLSIWRAQDIEGIESKKKHELSCSYGYVPVMEPGIFNGLQYDGRMVNITPNHVALVEQGRAGHDVRVSDALPEGLKMKRTQFERFARKAKRLLANDADIPAAELIELLGAAAGGADDDDTTDDPNAMDAAVPGAAMSFLKGKLTEDELAELGKCWRVQGGNDEDKDDDDDDKDGADDEDDKDDDEDKDDKPRRGANDRRRPVRAFDAASIRSAVIADISAWNEAVAKVTPHIGPVKLAMDAVSGGAATLYRRALDAHGVKHKGITQLTALSAMVDLLPTNRDDLAFDAAPAGSPSVLDDVLKGAVRSARS